MASLYGMDEMKWLHGVWMWWWWPEEWMIVKLTSDKYYHIMMIKLLFIMQVLSACQAKSILYVLW